jgi:hypothetical protein
MATNIKIEKIIEEINVGTPDQLALAKQAIAEHKAKFETSLRTSTLVNGVHWMGTGQYIAYLNSLPGLIDAKATKQAVGTLGLLKESLAFLKSDFLQKKKQLKSGPEFDTLVATIKVIDAFAKL